MSNDKEQQEPTPAPENSLPDWSECNRIIENYEFRKRAKAGLEGSVIDTTPTTPEPTELHRFIYEYDDADAYRSAWFLHRLELLLDETKRASIKQASAEVAGLVKAGAVGACHTKTWKHAANEWADTAYNGLQWLRNIEDGTTTDIKAARENLETCCKRAQQVADAVYREDAALASPPPSAKPISEEAYTSMLRDILAIQEACGLHTDEYAPGSVIEYIKELEESPPSDRIKLWPMPEDDGSIRQWYFDCDGCYIDVSEDDKGRFSILFVDRANNKKKYWMDQADAPTSAPVVPDDTTRLEWMSHRGARIAHSHDGETCNVWLPAEGRLELDARPAEGYPQKRYGSIREAIDAAMLAVAPSPQAKEQK